jgi:hypothetical protein
MTWVGFEPMIPAFERAKTIHALERAATLIGFVHTYFKEFLKEYKSTKNIKY